MSASTVSVSRAWSAFVGLPEHHPAIAALAKASVVRELPRGTTLLEEADSDSAVYLIGSGSLRSLRHTQQGQEVWFTDAGAGELVGEIAALTGLPRSSSVVARKKSVVFAVERPDFLAIAGAHGAVALAVARLLAIRLVRTSTQVSDLAALPVQNRVQRELERLGVPDKEGPAIRVKEPPSVTQLGQRIHATREATSRALKDLETRGMITREGDAWLLTTRDRPDPRD